MTCVLTTSCYVVSTWVCGSYTIHAVQKSIGHPGTQDMLIMKYSKVLCSVFVMWVFYVGIDIIRWQDEGIRMCNASVPTFE